MSLFFLLRVITGSGVYHRPKLKRNIFKTKKWRLLLVGGCLACLLPVSDERFSDEEKTAAQRGPQCLLLPLHSDGLVLLVLLSPLLHLQSLVKERAVCEEVLTRQIPGLSSRSSEVKGGQVEQLLEDAREEQERILSLTEKAELLAGVTQSRRLRQGLETWREDIREMDLATINNQDVTAIINKMIRTIRTIRTLVWSLANTST